MIRALLSAAAILSAATPALAQQTTPAPSAEARLEAAAEAFEKRMEAFGARAEAIAADESLSESERSGRVAAPWAEHQPEVTAFTAMAAASAGAIAAEALAEIDVDAVVAEAMNDPEVQAQLQQASAMGTGIAANSAWTNPDPEQLETYKLMTEYALAEVEESLEDMPEPPQAPEAPEAPEAP